MSRNASKSTRRRGRRGNKRHTLSRNPRKKFRSKYKIGNGAGCSVPISGTVITDFGVLKTIFITDILNEKFRMKTPQGGICDITVENIYYNDDDKKFYIKLKTDIEYYDLARFISAQKGSIKIKFSTRDIRSEYIDNLHRYFSENEISDETLHEKGLEGLMRNPVKITSTAEPKHSRRTPTESKDHKRHIDQTHTVPFTPTQLFR